MADHRNYAEPELAALLKEGDERAFKALIETYQRPLAKNLLRMLKSAEVAEEALQDLFVKVWQHRGQIDPEQPFRAYLFRMAQNLALDLLKKALREKKMLAHYQQFQTEIYSHIEETIISHENREVLNKAIEQMPEQRRKAYILCKLEGKSHEEAGELLGISPATINVQITRANAFLKKYFNADEGAALLLLAAGLLWGI